MLPRQIGPADGVAPRGQRTAGRLTLPAASALLLLVLGQACAAPPQTVSTETAASGPESWVTVFDPSRAWNGYTLAFYAHRVPILLDMNGRIVHRWPEARVKSRLRLLEDGSILAIALGRGLVEYDWDGNRTWSFEAEHGFAHHDVIRLANGNTVTLIRPDEGRFDDILEIDRAGEVVWQWHSGDHLRPFVLPRGWSKVDVTHLNSVQELPENSWYDRGDERFRPGNLLVSSRELNLVFIIDKPTGNLAWTFGGDLDKQHEPLMIGADAARAGKLLIFNNRYQTFYGDRQSSILEIDPVSGSPVWQYRSAGFYSPTSGVEQPLPNGNVLITSSRGGRTFEISRGGRVVWEWVPPFDTTRSSRYGYEHTPQLAAMEPPHEVAIRPSPGYRHIDTDVYRFARRGLRRDLELGGRKTSVLKHNNDCRTMVLPSGARAEVAYGLDSSKLSSQGREDYRARFRLEVRRWVTGETTRLLDETVGLDGETWHSRRLDLSAFALQTVDLCIATEQVGDPESTPTEGLALWQQPVIESARADTAALSEEDLALGELTPEELETRKKHLEALGYIQ